MTEIAIALHKSLENMNEKKQQASKYTMRRAMDKCVIGTQKMDPQPQKCIDLLGILVMQPVTYVLRSRSWLT